MEKDRYRNGGQRDRCMHVCAPHDDGWMYDDHLTHFVPALCFKEQHDSLHLHTDCVYIV